MTATPEKKVKVEELIKKVTKDGRQNVHRWWTLENEEEAAKSAWAMADNILDQQDDRQLEYQAYGEMYSYREYQGQSPTVKSGVRALLSRPRRALSNRVMLNVVKANIDTASAKLASARPRPMFLTVDGDYAMKKRAEKLTQYMDGVFDDTDIYTKGLQVFTDACINGTGAMKIYVQDGKIHADRCWIEEVLVDDLEAAYGDPRQMHHVMLYNREVLMATYGDTDAKKMLIATASATDEGGDMSRDMIRVTESWHLPSSSKAGDGKRCLSIQEGCLAYEEYDKDYFPFVFFRWGFRRKEFYGMGITEELFGIQIEINRILKNIQVAMKRVAQPRVFLEVSSRINKQHLNDIPGSQVSYSGQKPIFETPTAMNAEVYQHLERLYNKSFEITGISQLSATGKKPAGLDAAVALREQQDIESERFLPQSQRYDRFYIDASHIITDLSKDLYEEQPELLVKAKTNKVISEIKWKDVDMPADQYVMQVYPTSLLPTTPAAKKQQVVELMQADLLDRDTALDLLDFPDLKRALSVRNAGANDAMRTLERIVENGEYDTPEPYQNLDLCISLGQGMYLRSRDDGVPEERLELLRRFIDDCKELKGKSEPAQVAPIAQPPLAAPAAPPVNPMMPFPVPQ